MRHQAGNVLLYSEGPLHCPEIFGIRSISVSSEIKASAETSTCTRQNDHSAIGVNGNAIKDLMQTLHKFRRHGIQSLWAIESNHEDSRDRSFEDDDWCR
jgi:hypothetical protein